MDADIEEVREKFLNLDFDENTFQIDPEVTIEYARLCGETAERFLTRITRNFRHHPPTLQA